MSIPLTQSDHDIRTALKAIWGYDDFRPPQKEIINCLISQKDALIIMPTGGGKIYLFSTSRTTKHRINFSHFSFGGTHGKPS
jgi:hypothetical protein